MVFFVNKLRRDPRFANPTVVAVTDRTDLDNQLADTFTSTHLAPACTQAEEVMGGPRSLHELLRLQPAGGIVFTTIQKFAPPPGSGEMPVLSERRNIVVMADEAHRSQYAKFAENISLALPNAIRIGFTGTPVERADRSTRLVFGDYISIYRMRQAQEDRATVPIYYESRQIPIAIEDPDDLARVEVVLEAEEEMAAAKLVTAWAKLEKVVGAPDRLKALADDVAEHFTARSDALAGKAMVVAYSRRIAAAVTDLLRERLGAEHTLYVDKPMRDHGLLQAIARVNRVFRDKPGGLAVDYIGIGEDLRASLQAYDQTEIDDPVIPAAKAVARLYEKYEVISALLHPAGYRQGELHLQADPSRLFLDCYDHVLETEERTREFLDAQTALASWYALARTQPAVIDLREEVGFFNRLAAEVRKIAVPEAQASKEAEQAVRQFMSEGLAAREVVDVLGLADNDRPELSVLSDEFLDSLPGKTEHRNVQVRLLEKLLRDEIKSRMRTNRIQAQQFGERVQEVLRRYELKQLTSAEVVKRLVEIAKELRDARHRHEQLGLSEEEAAFYDALAAGVEHVTADPDLAAIAHELVASIRTDLTVDWTNREATQAKVRTKIKRLLRRHRKELTKASGAGGAAPQDLNYYTDLILDQARDMYRYWPEVGDRLFA